MAKKPTKKRPRVKSNTQILRSEELYKETGDFRYVVLTIGRCRPDAIPKWALDACRNYYERWELNHFTPIRGEKWKIPEPDDLGELLDKMADYILAHYDTLDKLKLSKANINAAVMYVIRDFTAIGQNAMSQRLTRAWVREMKERPISVHPDGQKSFSSHPRMEQAYFRNKRKESL